VALVARTELRLRNVEFEIFQYGEAQGYSDEEVAECACVIEIRSFGRVVPRGNVDVRCRAGPISEPGPGGVGCGVWMGDRAS
jgi:hypothetical protein